MSGTASPDHWNPQQYLRFSKERRQPFVDLIALIDPRPGMRVVDLGCGTGELTRDLHRHVQARETLGVDFSEAMLAKTAQFVEPGLRFQQGDIAAFHGGPFDLVFSNAALQWLPDHGSIFPRLAEMLAPEGQLAVQIPANQNHPSQTVLAAVAQEEPFRSALEGTVPSLNASLSPERYAEILHGLGFREQTVRLNVYTHLLPSRDDVFEWVKGTAVLDYRNRMPEALWGEFDARCVARLREWLPDTRPHLFTFNRTLIWGRR